MKRPQGKNVFAAGEGGTQKTRRQKVWLEQYPEGERSRRVRLEREQLRPELTGPLRSFRPVASEKMRVTNTTAT